MARVNFLPLEQRKQYLYDILDHARRKGVKFEKPATRRRRSRARSSSRRN